MVLGGRVWFRDMLLEIVPFENFMNAVKFPKSTVLTLFSENVIAWLVELYLQSKNSNWATLHWAVVIFSVGRPVETNVELQYASTPAMVMVIAIKRTAATIGDIPFISTKLNWDLDQINIT